MTREQLRLLISYAEIGLHARGGPRAMEYKAGNEAITAAKEYADNWPAKLATPAPQPHQGRL